MLLSKRRMSAVTMAEIYVGDYLIMKSRGLIKLTLH